MRNALMTEFRKLMTIRSTYVTTALALLLIFFMAFYVTGFKGSVDSDLDSNAYQNLIRNIIMLVWIFAAAIAVLFIVHEYRYNTIIHTLTAANSRTKVLLAKVIIVADYSILFALLSIGWGILSYHLGVSMRGGELAAQTISWLPEIARAVFYVFGYTMLGLMIGFISRNIAVTFVLLFIGLNIIESLLGILLKSNIVYLPITTLQQVLGMGPLSEGVALSPNIAVRNFVVYLIIGWVITWYLFNKRDAN